MGWPVPLLNVTYITVGYVTTMENTKTKSYIKNYANGTFVSVWDVFVFMGSLYFNQISNIDILKCHNILRMALIHLNNR